MSTAQILLLLGISVLPGAIIFHSSNTHFSKGVKPLLSLSGTFLLALSFCHLLPESYKSLGYEAGNFVLVGFFMQVILEYLTRGVEHGHYHSHGQFSQYFPILAIAGLTVHSVIESIPMVHNHSHGHSHNNYLLGILMHKAPIALTLASILKSSPLGIKKSWIWFSLFCISAPATVLIGNTFGYDNLIRESWQARFTAVAVGIFLHVSTTILFELEDGHKLKPSKLIAILLGLAIYFLTA